jgi:hypothetical protein
VSKRGQAAEAEAEEAARMNRLRAEMWSLLLLEELALRPHVLTDESLIAAFDAACGMVTTDRLKVVHPFRKEILKRMRSEK